MRQIIVTTMLSLDGVMQAPGGPEEDSSENFSYGGWSAPYEDEVGGHIVLAQLNLPSDYLMGRKTFDIWAAFWPHHADVWPGINNGTKYVLSKTATRSDWKNSVFIENLDQIKKFKASEGRDLQVWGSSRLVQLLLKNDLVDELWLRMYPVTLGSGKKLFAEGTIPANFTLTECLGTPAGVIVATYKRSGEVKTGTAGKSIGA